MYTTCNTHVDNWFMKMMTRISSNHYPQWKGKGIRNVHYSNCHPLDWRLFNQYYLHVLAHPRVDSCRGIFIMIMVQSLVKRVGYRPGEIKIQNTDPDLVIKMRVNL